MGAELAGGAWGEVRQGPAAMGRGEGAASGCAGARTSQGGPRPHMPVTSYQHCTKTAVSFRFFGCAGRRGALGCERATQHLSCAPGCRSCSECK